MEACCKECGNTFTPSRSQLPKVRNGEPVYCSRTCFHKSHQKQMTHKPTIRAACTACNSEFILSNVQRWKKETGKATEFFCCRSCAATWRGGKAGSQDWQRTPEMRRKRSEALKAFNWLQTPQARAKKMEVLRSSPPTNPDGPPIRGGNGKRPPVPQEMLATALGWQMEHIFPTRMPKGSGYPSHFKIDIANPAMMIAIEVDGGSHNSISRKEQDGRKESFLSSRGWCVLRFSNQEVMENLSGCVQTVLFTTLRLLKTTTSSPKAS